MQYIVERCEMCGETDIRQNQPPAQKFLREPGQRPRGLSVCHKCGLKIDAYNKPQDDADREADEAAAAVMKAKLDAEKQKELDKEQQKEKMVELMAQQNNAMLQMMQQTQALLVQLVQQNAKQNEPRRTRKPRQEMQLPES